MKNFTSSFKKSERRQKEERQVRRNFAEQSRELDIVILPELRSFIPKLKDEESRQLEQNILAEGVRDPLVIWEHDGKQILIDGHNRYRVIQKHGIEKFKIERREFPSMEAVKDWMINLQLGRRNLTKSQMSHLRGMLYSREKKKHTDFLKQGKSPSAQNEQTGDTGEKLAKMHKVSRATIVRDAEFARGIEKIDNQELKADILAGDVVVKKSDIQKLAKLEEPVVVKTVSDITKAISTPKKKEASVKSEVKKNQEIKRLRRVLDRLEKKKSFTQKDYELLEDEIRRFKSLIS